MMNIDKFIEVLFDKAKKDGLNEFEVYYSKSKSFSLKIFEGELDDYKNAISLGLSFRAIFEGQMGYSYTENFDENSVDMLIKEVKDNASTLERESVEYIYDTKEDYKEINKYKGFLEKIEIDKKISFAKKMEEEAKAIDKRVSSVNYCVYGDGIGERIIVSSNGLSLKDKGDEAYCYISVIVKDGDDTKTGNAFCVSSNFEDFNAKELAKEAVQEAISLLGADSLESGEYDVIIRNKAFASLLGTMSGVFSAEAVEKDLSRLAGKIGETIAVKELSIIDNPHLENGGSTKAFDDEGVATKSKKVIENGVLKTYLHNLKTAKNAGLKSTGNAQKGSYKGDIGIAPFNFYIEPQKHSLDELIKELGNGLLLIEFGGLHSGINTISGDFSFITSGYYVENGEIVKPVNQITIAGNYFEILKNIEIIGSDLKFNLPSVETFGSPSVLIRNVKIAGKK